MSHKYQVEVLQACARLVDSEQRISTSSITVAAGYSKVPPTR
jgi:hypothetical protein